jgi:hypothetical protein
MTEDKATRQEATLTGGDYGFGGGSGPGRLPAGCWLLLLDWGGRAGARSGKRAAGSTDGGGRRATAAGSPDDEAETEGAGRRPSVSSGAAAWVGGSRRPGERRLAWFPRRSGLLAGLGPNPKLYWAGLGCAPGHLRNIPYKIFLRPGPWPVLPVSQLRRWLSPFSFEPDGH